MSDNFAAGVLDCREPHRLPGKGAEPKLAVLVPCFNEGCTIAGVVRAFRAALPDATVYVYDNNSTDDTLALAQQAGAVVRKERLQGKGNVVRRMFADVDADIYVLVDGDDTYDAASAPMLVRHLIAGQYDMVNAARDAVDAGAFRPGHRFGNLLLTRTVASVFGNQLNDMLSGYRVLSRRFVLSFPALSRGFEIETELTVHALELRMPIAEVSVPYRERPAGSVSKLRTFRDGFRILRLIGFLVREERPLPFFGSLALLLASLSILLAWPIVVTYMQTGLVPRLPTAVLATGCMLLAFLSLGCGLVLGSVTLSRQEMKRMWYIWAEKGRPGR
jgi:glycosyltransferase involved in cell wall biosynthesis